MIKELVKRGSGKAFFGVQAFGRAGFLVVLLEQRVLEQDSVWRKPSSGSFFPERATHNTKMFTNPKFEYPFSWVTRTLPL